MRSRQPYHGKQAKDNDNRKRHTELANAPLMVDGQ